MSITLTVSDDVARQLKPYESQLPQIVELGIRELHARSESGYHGVNNVLERLAALPSPEEVLALRPSPTLQERIDVLLEKNRTVGFSDEDQREWDQYKYLEHLVRQAKTSALRKVKEIKGQ